MKKCDTCIYRNNVEQLKPCIIYRDNCEYYEKERDMTKGEKIAELINIRDNFNYTLAPREVFDDAIKALEQEPSGDLISRDELLKAIDTWDKFGVDDTNSLFRLDNLSLPHYVPYIHYDDVIKCIKGMPSVNPQEPKTGHWIKTISENGITSAVRCSGCGFEDNRYMLFRYCPNCGCRMVEPQESEDKE